MSGAMIAGGRPRPHHRRLRHLLDVAPGVARGGRMADRCLVDALRRPVRGRRPTERLAGRPHGPSLPGARRAGPGHGVLRRLPVHPLRPAPDGPRRDRGPRLRRRPAVAAVAPHPGVRAVRGRAHPGHVRHAPRRRAPRCRRPWPARPSPSPGGCRSCRPSAFTAVALVATAVVWRKVPGHVHPQHESCQPIADGGSGPQVDDRDRRLTEVSRRRTRGGRSGGGGRQRRGAVGTAGGQVGHLGQALGALADRVLARGTAEPRSSAR